MPGLLAHSSSQGEDRARHSGREMAIEQPLSTRFFQPKTQDSPGLLTGLEQFAPGSLTEVPEILCGAGVSRENFEHRARGERLQRPPRLQHRQGAEQAGGIEGCIDSKVIRLAHFPTLDANNPERP